MPGNCNFMQTSLRIKDSSFQEWEATKRRRIVKWHEMWKGLQEWQNYRLVSVEQLLVSIMPWLLYIYTKYECFLLLLLKSSFVKRLCTAGHLKSGYCFYCTFKTLCVYLYISFCQIYTKNIFMNIQMFLYTFRFWA